MASRKPAPEPGPAPRAAAARGAPRRRMAPPSPEDEGGGTDGMLIRPAAEILEPAAVLARLTEVAAAAQAEGKGRDGVRAACADPLREALSAGHAAIREALEARPWAGASTSRSIAWLACKPATVFTSIGKKVITTTTAAFDCQSKPNHMTIMGAIPITGSAETKLPTGSRPRCRKGTRSMMIARMKALPQPSR